MVSLEINTLPRHVLASASWGMYWSEVLGDRETRVHGGRFSICGASGKVFSHVFVYRCKLRYDLRHVSQFLPKYARNTSL